MDIPQSEKNRRSQLLQTHYEVENAHNMDGIMDTFSENSEMLYNHASFSDDQSIRGAHTLIGFNAQQQGAFKGIQNHIDKQHYTEQEIVVEGRLCAQHVGEFQGFAASGNEVELPFVAFYHFDSHDKLVSERVVMNLAPLAQSIG